MRSFMVCTTVTPELWQVIEDGRTNGFNEPWCVATMSRDRCEMLCAQLNQAAARGLEEALLFLGAPPVYQGNDSPTGALITPPEVEQLRKNLGRIRQSQRKMASLLCNVQSFVTDLGRAQRDLDDERQEIEDNLTDWEALIAEPDTCKHCGTPYNQPANVDCVCGDPRD